MSVIRAAVVDGEARGQLLLPTGEGPFPLVVALPDAGGLRPVLVEMAEHLTDAGYAALLVDPYWRQEPWAPFDTQTVFADPQERARLMAMIGTMKVTEWIADTEALVEALPPEVSVDRVGAIGWCMGGRAAFLLAAAWGERVAAAVGVHAGGLVGESEGSPHRRADQVIAQLHFAVADEDRSCTPEQQATLRAALDEAGVSYRLVVHEGAHHGFAVPDFPTFDPAAARASWSAALALFDRALR